MKLGSTLLISFVITIGVSVTAMPMNNDNGYSFVNNVGGGNSFNSAHKMRSYYPMDIENECSEHKDEKQDHDIKTYSPFEKFGEQEIDNVEIAQINITPLEGIVRTDLKPYSEAEFGFYVNKKRPDDKKKCKRSYLKLIEASYNSEMDKEETLDSNVIPKRTINNQINKKSKPFKKINELKLEDINVFDCISKLDELDKNKECLSSSDIINSLNQKNNNIDIFDLTDEWN